MTAMKSSEKGKAGGYAPVHAAEDAEPDPLVPVILEAYAVRVPRTIEYVELQAPANLPGGYELTVVVDGEQLVVLVVSLFSDWSLFFHIILFLLRLAK